VSIVGGLDVHRGQITFDWVDRDSGEARRGRIAPATRPGVRAWLEGLPCRQGAFAVEGCTGWRFVAEELIRAGVVAHLAEPAETSSLRGPKRRARTDRADARLLRELRGHQRLPESWIPPGWILDLRASVRLRKTLARPWSISAPPSSSAAMRCGSTRACPTRPAAAVAGDAGVAGAGAAAHRQPAAAWGRVAPNRCHRR
jgi:hypothetical protein